MSINRLSLSILLVISRTGKVTFPLFPFAAESLVSQDRFGRPVPRQACSFSILRLNLVLTKKIPPVFRDGVYLFVLSTAMGSVPSLNQVTHLRTDGIHCRESGGTGPVVLRVVPVTGAAFSGITTDQLMCASRLFSHTIDVTVDIHDNIK